MTSIAWSEDDRPDAAAASAAAGGWARFRRRFHAWWEGVELPPVAPAASARDRRLAQGGAGSAACAPEPLEELARTWPARRIDAAELIWGDGFIGPGGNEAVVTWAKPLGLSPALSVLEIGAGIGGTTRAIAAAFGVWITGVERDGDLVREAAERVKATALEKKAVVRHYGSEPLEIKAGSVDCILSRGFFHTVADKQALFASLRAALKERGQLLFTDYVLGPQPRGAALDHWIAGESTATDPASPELLSQLMKQHRLDCRIAADNSGEHRGEILQAWAALRRRLEQGEVPRHLLERVMQEAERWTRLLRALDAGEIRSYRFHAFRA